MALRPPRLDDRTYTDLVEELLRRIPAHTPEYTDPRPGDPGRTMIELFAWLTDTLLYRVNFIPERQRLEFLRRVGLPLRSAQPATGLVALSYANLTVPTATVEGLTLQPFARVQGPESFETRSPVTVLPVAGEVWFKRALTPAEQAEMEPLIRDLAELYELGDQPPRGYVSTPAFVEGQPSRSLEIVEDAVDNSLWIALLAGHAGAVEPARLILGENAQGERQVLSIGIVPVMEARDPYVRDLASEVSERRPIPVIWEVSTGRSGPEGPIYRGLEIRRDGTEGLTRTGVVELLLPSAADLGTPSNDAATDLDAGVGPRPPRLDDPSVAERVVTWVRLRPAVPVDRLELDWIGINAVVVDQRTTLTNVGIGVSTGLGDQRFRLPSGAVDRTTLEIQVEEEGHGWVPWRLVEHLGLVGPDERSFALDDEEGIVAFGDGLRGRIPETGRRIRAAFLRAGGGEAGNLPPGALKSITGRLTPGGGALTRALKVVQPTATRGGVAGETLAEAEARLPQVLRHRNRAVTARDYQALVAGTPGVQIGRVEVIPGFKPHQRREDVPGVVSVMVLPRRRTLLPPNPRPGRHTIETVHDWLAPRVPLATEVYVIGCEYVPIGVSVGYELREGHPRDQTTAAVRQAVRRLLWPLPPGGPFEAATGWPLGRPVRDRELEVAVSRVPGVDEVLGITLFTEGTDETWVPVEPGPDGAASIPMDRWQLPEVLSLAVKADGAPSDLDDRDRFAGNEVAVPVVPEVC